jgi:hypothetical protein
MGGFHVAGMQRLHAMAPQQLQQQHLTGGLGGAPGVLALHPMGALQPQQAFDIDMLGCMQQQQQQQQ